MLKNQATSSPAPDQQDHKRSKDQAATKSNITLDISHSIKSQLETLKNLPEEDLIASLQSRKQPSQESMLATALALVKKRIENKALETERFTKTLLKSIPHAHDVNELFIELAKQEAFHTPETPYDLNYKKVQPGDPLNVELTIAAGFLEKKVRNHNSFMQALLKLMEENLSIASAMRALADEKSKSLEKIKKFLEPLPKEVENPDYFHQIMFNQAIDLLLKKDQPLSAANAFFRAYLAGSSRVDSLFFKKTKKALVLRKEPPAQEIEDKTNHPATLETRSSTVIADKSFEKISEESNEENFRKGLCHLAGIPPYEQSDQKAFEHLQLAANEDHIDAQYLLARILLERHTDLGLSEKEAAEHINRHLQKATERKHPAALFLSGTLYSCDEDLQAAAKLNYPRALWTLGLKAREANQYDAAYEHFENASEQGYAKAQTSLGLLYKEDKIELETMSLTEREKKALELYSEASKEEDPKAKVYLADLWFLSKTIKLEMSTEEKEAIAFQYYKEAAEKGIPHAECRLGEFYYHSLGETKKLSTEERTEKAIEYFKKAALKKIPVAEFHLGEIYNRRWTEGKDNIDTDKIACEWYFKAAEHGFSLARSQLESMKKQKRTQGFIETQIQAFKTATEEELAEYLLSDYRPFDDELDIVAATYLLKVRQNSEKLQADLFSKIIAHATEHKFNFEESFIAAGINEAYRMRLEKKRNSTEETENEKRDRKSALKSTAQPNSDISKKTVAFSKDTKEGSANTEDNELKGAEDKSDKPLEKKALAAEKKASLSTNKKETQSNENSWIMNTLWSAITSDSDSAEDLEGLNPSDNLFEL